VTLQKYFSHPSLAIYIFATPPVRLELGTTNSKPPGPIIMINQSKIRISMRSYLLHSSLEVHSVAAVLISLSKLSKYGGEKPFQEPNRHILTFLHPIVMCSVTY
jgi:hypothetical protein